MTFTAFQCGDNRTTNDLLADFYLQQLGRTPECEDIFIFESLEREWLYFKLGISDLECTEKRTNKELFIDFLIADMSIDYQCNESRTFNMLLIDWLIAELGTDYQCTDPRSLNVLLSDYLYENVS